MNDQILCRRLAAALAVLAVIITAASGWAQSRSAASERTDETEQAYARYYGDGLRHYAEGDFEAAVENLFRAYAIRPEASTMGLIVRSYDQMGFCDAANRQVAVYRLVHDDKPVPEIDRCQTTGGLVIECEGRAAPIRVDGQFEAACGQRLTLPVGEHALSSERIDGAHKVSVSAGQTATARLTLTPRPQRWEPHDPPRIGQLSDPAVDVERLGAAGMGYTVFQSADGLYRIFILPDAGASGGLIGVPVRPDVLRLCDSGQRFDPGSHRCRPIGGMQIQKME